MKNTEPVSSVVISDVERIRKDVLPSRKSTTARLRISSFWATLACRKVVTQVTTITIASEIIADSFATITTGKAIGWL